jgi:hypothetical protein
MKQKILSLFILISFVSQGQTRKLHFDFPALAGDTLKLYYAQGNKTDSLSIELGHQGKADILFPLPDFRGMVHLYSPEAGGTEFIVAEPDMHIVCEADQINQESVRLPDSEENSFLFRIFNRKAQLLGHIGWILQGGQLYKPGTEMIAILEKELSGMQKELVVVDDSIARSPLYAAKFLKIAGFMDRLFDAEQQLDPKKWKQVSTEMENTLDVVTLYSTGQFWGSAHNHYINLFNRFNDEDKQEQYAASILKTALRLNATIRESFFAGAIQECERFGWAGAEGIILRGIVNNYPDMELKDGQLRRLTGIFKTIEKSKAPALVGVKLTSVPTLLLFYETGCGNCEVQIEALKRQYPLLKQKGIRVITLSSDGSKEVFEQLAKDFPWEDKLCDYKGFEGENFLRYGIIGTPTFYFIDKDGIIQGRYATLSEIEAIR